ncbi:MAG: biotin/lipoyl-binding protein [Planctomycetes bacterium]|nr:biotin/lipoyl-binding protein [Planctomycetota bacterium]
MWKWMLVGLSFVGIGLAVLAVLSSGKEPAARALATEPVSNPFPRSVAGVGMVEPESRAVVIGVPDPGLVARLHIRVGELVKKGDPLFEVDSRSLAAQLETARASVATAEATLAQVVAYRRPTDEPLLLAKLAEAVANVAQAEQKLGEEDASDVEADLDVTEALEEVQEFVWQLDEDKKEVARLQATGRALATSQEELDRAMTAQKITEARKAVAEHKVELTKSKVAVVNAQTEQAKAALEAAKARQAQADADLASFRAGAWDVDVRKAEAALAEAEASAARLQKEIERLTVLAPLDATVLRCNLKEGEYAAAGGSDADHASLVLGDIDPFHVRVEIDEFDAKFVRPDAKAVAYLRTDKDKPIELEFAHVEPYVVPKKALTNAQSELVDTRVLQVVYRVKSSPVTLYVGLQLEVFIEEK